MGSVFEKQIDVSSLSSADKKLSKRKAAKLKKEETTQYMQEISVANVVADEPEQAVGMAERLRDLLTLKTWKETLILYTYILVGLDLAFVVFRYIMYFVTLNHSWMWNSIIFTIIFGFGPFVVWALSTDITEHNWHNAKRRWLIAIFIHLLLILLQFIIKATAIVVFPLLTRINISFVFQYDMVLIMGRFVSVLPPLIFCCVVIPNVIIAFNKDFYGFVDKFKLGHYIDRRKNKDTAYDQNTVFNDLRTGKDVSIWENDRYTHQVVIGASGTGKTSSVLLTSLMGDLDKCVKNEEALKEALLRFVMDGKGFFNIPVNTDFAKANFDPSIVHPRKEYVKEYEDLLLRYRSLGAVVIAPDEDLCYHAMDLCIARGFGSRLQLIDPTILDPKNKNTYMKYGEYLHGLNPLFVPVGLSLNEEVAYISAAAKNFASVLEAIDKLNGSSGDRFFSGVNRAITRNLAAVCMLFYPQCMHRQATVADVQTHLQNFATLGPVMEQLFVLYGSIDGTSKGTKTGKSLLASGWKATFQNISNELLNAERAKTNFDYAYGLRNMVDELIADPRIKGIFTRGSGKGSAEQTNAKVINFDRALKNGEIIICNYALNLGEETAVGFGTFFQLSFNQAVFNRDISNPAKIIPFMEYMDELPVLLTTPWLERSLALFRKYKVSFQAFCQSISQLDKNDMTKYLRGIVMQCGTICLYGRASGEEMKLFSELSGTSEIMVAQSSVNETSLTTSNPNYSYGTRYTPTDKENVTATDIRYRDFQEGTLYYLENGNVVEPILIKTHFLPSNAYDQVDRVIIDWNQAAERYPVKDEDLAYLNELKAVEDELLAEYVEKMKNDDTFMWAEESIYEERLEAVNFVKSVEMNDNSTDEVVKLDTKNGFDDNGNGGEVEPKVVFGGFDPTKPFGD